MATTRTVDVPCRRLSRAIRLLIWPHRPILIILRGDFLGILPAPAVNPDAARTLLLDETQRREPAL